LFSFAGFLDVCATVRKRKRSPENKDFENRKVLMKKRFGRGTVYLEHLPKAMDPLNPFPNCYEFLSKKTLITFEAFL